MFEERGTGALKSPLDVRTFSYRPDKAGAAPQSGGETYPPKNIGDQHSVGICTSASAMQHAKKALGEDFSWEFQYLCQKKIYDGNWDEGSSAFSAVRVMKNIGMLPASDWTYTTEEDRKLPYHEYIKKLQAVPDVEFEKLKTIAANYKIKGYARLADTSRDTMARAIAESDRGAGIIARFVIDSRWWTTPIEPLRPPINPISGHLIDICKFVGDSFRNANTWGTDWADSGTAYFLRSMYAPTEAWVVWYNDLPAVIEQKLEDRESIKGKILDLLQQIIVLLAKL